MTSDTRQTDAGATAPDPPVPHDEPNPYEPPKSLTSEEETPETEISRTYVRPLARRNAAAAVTGLEGAIVLMTLLIAWYGRTANLALSPLMEGLVLFRFTVSIVGLILFLSWFYRKYKNLYVFDKSQMRCTPGWAVGYWFVPILNLMRPIQCVYDIWRGGALDGEPPKGNPLFGFWWATWLTSGVMGQIATAMPESSIYIASNLLDLLLVVLTIAVIRALAARQDRKAQSLGLLK